MSPPPKLTVATAQFAINADVAANAARARALIARAARRGADLVHLPEGALSGYASAQFRHWDGYDWQALAQSLRVVQQSCRQHGVWAVFGCCHRVRGAGRPCNAVYVVDSAGRIRHRYDKRRCSMRELDYYAPGDQPVLFEVAGVRCGVLVCLEWSFPELWRSYADSGVDLVLLSAYGAGHDDDVLHTHVIPPTIQGHAFTNCLFVSVSNACNRLQAFPSFWARRSGRLGTRCRRNVPGMALNAILDEPAKDDFYRMVRRFRASARDGSLYAMDHTASV